MELKTAKLISDLLLSQADQQNKILLKIRISAKDDEFETARNIISKIMGSIYLDGLHPIFVMHPSLRPKEIS